MPVNIFRDATSSVPRSDSQIVRVPMDENEVGGRKDHLPANAKSDAATIQHVPNAGTK